MNSKIHVAVCKVNTHTFPGVIHNRGMETIGDRLRKLREARQLTQDQVAEKIGVRQGSYTQLETGKTKTPRSSNLAKYARLYGVDPEWLMTGKGSQHPISTLSDDESDLVVVYRSLSPEGRGYVLGRARAIHKDEHGRDDPHRREDPPSPRGPKPQKPDGH